MEISEVREHLKKNYQFFICVRYTHRFLLKVLSIETYKINGLLFDTEPFYTTTMVQGRQIVRIATESEIEKYTKVITKKGKVEKVSEEAYRKMLQNYLSSKKIDERKHSTSNIS